MSRNLILKSNQGLPENNSYRVRLQTDFKTKQLCIFSSYSFMGDVEEYVYYYLSELKNAGFSIAFISTSSSLNDECLRRLSETVFLVVERENKCPDFGSWKLGIELLNVYKDFDGVLLANDSVFGPFFNIREIVEKMRRKYDIWGMTDSYEIDYHIQSYFLYFNKNVILSSAWHSFWQNVDTTLTKQQVINKYEVGLTKYFLNAKFSVGVYSSVDIVHKSASHDHKYINTSLGFWKLLIDQYDFPFIKREILIKLDIQKVYWERGLYINIGGWRKTISNRTHYPISNIDTFLEHYHRFFNQEKNDLMLQKRKILFLSHNTEAGGAQRVLLNFIKWFKNNTTIPFEIIICRAGEDTLLNEFIALGNTTVFHGLSDYDQYKLKNRLISEQISLIFSNTMVNIEVQKFLSFLDVPQIVFVHELSYVLNSFSEITNNVEWVRKNVVHFVACAEVVKSNLIEFLSIEEERVSVVYEFIENSKVFENPNDLAALRKKNHIPERAFVIGMSGTFEWRKSADLIPVIASALCTTSNDIHLVWLGADVKSALYKSIVSDIKKAGLSERVHLVSKKEYSRSFFEVFDIFLMISREDPFPLVNLESGASGKPVICFQNSGGSEEYVSLNTGSSVPYLDIASLVEKVNEYYSNQHLLSEQKKTLKEIVRNNFTTEVQAPKLLSLIKNYYDENELMLVERPVVVIMVHVFFDNTWSELKAKLKHFDNGTNYFLFSICEACIIKDFIVQDIKESFTNAYTVISSNVGRDIGSKMVLIDLYLTLEIKSKYIIFLHDKQSVHTLVGESWKRNLFRVLDPVNYQTILNDFKDESIGIIGAKDHFINEYDERTDLFRHNNFLSKEALRKYNIKINNYNYISGTIYWIRSSIIENFFRNNNPIEIRKSLESGNVLDYNDGTMVHTWERLFCWIATDHGYSIKGF